MPSLGEVTYEPMYDIEDDHEFACALAPTIELITRLGATEEEIKETIDLHVYARLKKQQEKQRERWLKLQAELLKKKE